MRSVRISTKNVTVQVQCNGQLETNLTPESKKFAKTIFKHPNIVQGI